MQTRFTSIAYTLKLHLFHINPSLQCPLLALLYWCPIFKSITLRLRENGLHFTDDISKCIFFNEKFWISNYISLKYFPYGLLDNMAALVQIMAWRRRGDKPLSEPIMVSLPTYICVTRPQWVKSSHCNSFEDWAIVDFIYGCPIFKWVAVTWFYEKVPGQ